MIPEFCDFLTRDVVRKVVCRYQHTQNHCPLEAGFVNKNYNQTCVKQIKKRIISLEF
jgi:hypothetical protein